MPRQRRAAGVRRLELRFSADDPVLEELSHEAEQRHVELQQHIYDLLRGRYLLRRGESLAALLWLPGERGEGAANTAPGQAPTARDPAAAAAALAWDELLGVDQG
jgi:hypothetical protein